MKYALVLFLSLSASASEYKQFYLVNGTTVETSEALLRALKGEEVVKCNSVEAKPNKKGTSIGLHNVKKKAE